MKGIMWENNSPKSLSDDRKREYEKQQERLKAMAASADKVKSVSADKMIENLLKEPFKESYHIPTNSKKHDHFQLEFPSWLHCDSVTSPVMYSQMWSIVQSDVNIADTQKVSQLLLTSGLRYETLGYIWSLANKTIPGKLTKQEFYFVLALVGLAQTGYTFNSLNDLKTISTPLVPILQVQDPNRQSNHLHTNLNNCNLLQESQSSSGQEFVMVRNFLENKNAKENKDHNLSYDTKVNTNFTCGNVFHNQTEKVNTNTISGYDLDKSSWVSSSSFKPNELNVIDTKKEFTENSNFSLFESSSKAEAEDEFSEFQCVPIKSKNSDEKPSDLLDNFSDFQSASIEHSDPFETVVISQKREIPKIPLPQTLTGKLSNLKSNILKISPESERKLKVLSKAESLSSLPESKISSNNEVSTSVSVLGTNQDIGNRLANHSVGAKLNRPKHHKFFKIKNVTPSLIEPSTDKEIILGMKTTNTQNLVSKCCPKKPINCRSLILKETKIRNEDLYEYEKQNDLIESKPVPPLIVSSENTRQIQIPMLGTFNETVLPTQSKSQNLNIDLISVQEDKYSALRDINLKIDVPKSPKTSLVEESDDFGDFLSADIPPPASSLATNLEGLPPSTELTSTAVFENKENKKNDMEDWGDWNCSTSNNLNALPTNQGCESLLFSKDSDPLESLSHLSLNEVKADVMKASGDSQPVVFSEEFFKECDLKVPDTQPRGYFNVSEFEKKENDENSFQSHSDQLASSDWNFLSFDSKPSTGGSLSRQGSLPSLDLKMSMNEETEQEIVWRKCLEFCHNLIQEGFEIFNNVKPKSVLNEVFAAKKTSSYLNYLNIVNHVSKRVSQNLSGFSSHQEDIKRHWSYLEELCFKYNVKLKPDEDSASEGKTQCNICFNFIKNDSINKGTSNYHPSCANLWVNFIEESLPFSS